MKGADQECLRAGMDAYLTKRIDREALDEALMNFLKPSAKEGTGDEQDEGLMTPVINADKAGTAAVVPAWEQADPMAR